MSCLFPEVDNPPNIVKYLLHYEQLLIGPLLLLIAQHCQIAAPLWTIIKSGRLLNVHWTLL